MRTRRLARSTFRAHSLQSAVRHGARWGKTGDVRRDVLLRAVHGCHRGQEVIYGERRRSGDGGCGRRMLGVIYHQQQPGLS